MALPVHRGIATILAGAVAGGLFIGSAGSAPAAVGVAAGAPKPDRHTLLTWGCTWDGTSSSARTTVRASTILRTKDMKNNNDARVPGFYRLKAKVEIKTERLGGVWRTDDHSTVKTQWLERHGIWIHKRYQPTPYTDRNAARGSWTWKFGDTTLMTDPGDKVAAKITVTLDKKPGGKVWKYSRWTPIHTCPNGGFHGSP